MSFRTILPSFLILFLYLLFTFDGAFPSQEQRKALLTSIIPKVYVVLAADFDSAASVANYGILAPLTSFIWHRVFNVTPVVMLSTRDPGRLTTSTEAAFSRLVHRAGGRVHCISKSHSNDNNGAGVSIDPELVGATLITALQVSRLASIALTYVNDEDVIFTTDADIWPMSKSFWNGYISRSLKQGNDDFFVYNGPFFYGQRQVKDCNFLAVTIGFGSKIRLWRSILSTWLDSLQYSPSPRSPLCLYGSSDNSSPILPWYTDTERNRFILKNVSFPSGLDLSFPDLLTLFLKQGRRMYGKVWEKEIWYTGMSYKLRNIWDFDQILMTEMILAFKPSVITNSDLRRLDKFRTRNKESEYNDNILGKSANDFTDAHLDIVEDSNWWRLESIWLLVFRDVQASLLSDAQQFLSDVRSFYDGVRGTDDEVIRGSLFFQDDLELKNALGLCDNV